MPNSLSSEQLHQLARLGARARLEELRREMSAIQSLVGETSPGGRRGRPTGRRRRRRGKLSAAGRARIAAAQRARWAKIKRAKNARKTGGRKRKATSSTAKPSAAA